MRRAVVLVAMMTVGGLVALLAQQPSDAPKVVDVEKVKDNLLCCAAAAATPPCS